MNLPAEASQGSSGEQGGSRKFVNYTGPSPPHSARRRGAKTTNSSDREGNILSPLVKACIKEVQSPDPLKHDKPIKEFTRLWLSDSTSRWPKLADACMKTTMHTKSWYTVNPDFDLEWPDRILMLVAPLRKGTKIEEFFPDEYIEFGNRVGKRLVLITQDLLAKKLIESDGNGGFRKSSTFKTIWMNRQTHWTDQRNAAASEQVQKAPSIAEDIQPTPTNGESIDKETHFPRARENSAVLMPPPPKPTQSSPVSTPLSLNADVDVEAGASGVIKADNDLFPIFHPRTPPATPKKRKMPAEPPIVSPSSGRRELECDNTLPEDETRPLHKRQKRTAAPSHSPNPSAACPESDELEEFSAIGHLLREESIDDHDIQEAILLDAQEILDSDIAEAVQSVKPVLPFDSVNAPPIALQEAHLLTPPSHVRSPSGASRSISPQPSRTEPMSFERASISPFSERPPTLPSLAPPWSPTPSQDLKPTSTSTPPPATPSFPAQNQRLELILETSERKFDMSGTNTLSSSHLRDYTNSQFFSLYASRTNVPLETLDSLTFTFLFTNDQDMLVQKGNEEEWERLRDLASMLFRLYSKRRPGRERFLVAVEIGDAARRVDEDGFF